VLTLLVLGTTLQAQSARNGRAGVPQSGATAEFQQNYGTPTSSECFSFDGRVMSTEAERNEDPQNDVDIQPASVGHFAIFAEPCPTGTLCAGQFSNSKRWSSSIDYREERLADNDKLHEGSTPRAPVVEQHSKHTDFNRSIYYKNKLEFGLDVGWLPINIPFVFDVFLGDGYNMTPLKYTLVPVIASMRWHMNDVGGPSFLRGNWDLSTSAGLVAIPRGPETRYYSWIMGIRRNFVPHNWRVAPYFDGRLGLGNIDARGPKGVAWAQGEDFTFTLNMGAGVRYNFSPKYSLSAGMNYMHISNLYLSEPRYGNYGINVYGPMFGLDVRLGKPHRGTTQ
jgi:Lipid A 3-O-deacylase (PagL)